MILLFRFFCFLFIVSTYAQVGGSSSFSFLNLESSPRINALGGYAPIVIDDDPNLGFYNPVLINPLTHSILSLSYVNYYSDINYGSIIYSPNFSNKTQLLFGVKYVDYGLFQETDEFGNLIGSFNASEYLFSTGTSKFLYNDDKNFIKMGLSLKMAFSHLYTDFSLAFLSDFSFLYYNKKKDITTSVLVKNLGHQIIKYSDGNTEKMPFEIVAGISNKLSHMPLRWSFSLQHLENWDLNFENDNQSSELLLNSNSNLGDEILRHVVLGLEFLITKNLNIRFGYNNRRRYEMMILDRKAMVGFSYGFSFKINKFKFNYGRGLNHFSGPVNSVGISTNISSF